MIQWEPIETYAHLPADKKWCDRIGEYVLIMTKKGNAGIAYPVYDHTDCGTPICISWFCGEWSANTSEVTHWSKINNP